MSGTLAGFIPPDSRSFSSMRLGETRSLLHAQAFGGPHFCSFFFFFFFLSTGISTTCCSIRTFRVQQRTAQQEVASARSGSMSLSFVIANVPLLPKRSVGA